jgi:ABC-type bacteriocin/lantibiotic exporter with double-glycine peptidase domain
MTILDVPFYPQEHPVSCLPACAWMVLSFWGRDHSENELAEVFHLHSLLGVQPEQAVIGLNSLGYQALWFEKATVDRLYEILNHGWPAIIFLSASDLPHGQSGIHALVLVGFQDELLYCLDHALNKKKGRITLKLNEFKYLWRRLDNQGLIIWLSSTAGNSY